MDILTIINFLDTNFTRKIKTTKNDTDIVAWENKNNLDISVTVDENSTTYTNVIQLCLKETNNTIYLYVNHIVRRKLTKIPITTIDDIGAE